MNSQTVEVEVNQKDTVEPEVKKILPKEPNLDISSISEELEKLVELRKKGFLTDEEFKAAKGRIIE